jgi:hypothetical protein
MNILAEHHTGFRDTDPRGGRLTAEAVSRSSTQDI